MLFITLILSSYNMSAQTPELSNTNCVQKNINTDPLLAKNTRENIHDINSLLNHEKKFIYYTSEDFHNELIFKASDFSHLPEDYNRSEYLSIGFGSLKFWQTPDFHEKSVKNKIKIAGGVLLKPTKGVMSVTGLSHLPIQSLNNKVALSDDEFRKVLKYVKESFISTDDGSWQVADSNLNLYKSNRNYSAVFTCNSWVSKALSQSSSFNFRIHHPLAKSLNKKIIKQQKENRLTKAKP